mgnify:CR=1 FL=1
MRPRGFDSVTILATVAFAALLAAIAFCLGYFLLGVDAGRSALVGVSLGSVQSAGALFYIWRRFVRTGPPPRGGGQPG